MSTTTETRTRITEGTLTSLREGDEVVLTKGTNVIREKVASAHGSRFLDLGFDEHMPRIRAFIDAGYTVEKIVPKPPMPTEPGHYTDKYGKPWLLRTPWGDREPWVAWDGHHHTAEAAERSYAPFTRVVPAPTTPEAVKDRDGDTWKKATDGTWVLNTDDLTKGGGETLEYVRRAYGPLTNLNGDPA